MKDVRRRYEDYQTLMSFLCEELPAKGWRVVNREPLKFEGEADLYEDLSGDKRENLVRRFLNLPTVQHDRKKADELLKEIQAKANKK